MTAILRMYSPMCRETTVMLNKLLFALPVLDWSPLLQRPGVFMEYMGHLDPITCKKHTKQACPSSAVSKRQEACGFVELHTHGHHSFTET